MYGTSDDVAIRVMVKESRTATHIRKQHGMSAILADLANLVEIEKKDERRTLRMRAALTGC